MGARTPTLVEALTRAPPVAGHIRYEGAHHE